MKDPDLADAAARLRAAGDLLEHAAEHEVDYAVAVAGARRLVATALLELRPDGATPSPA
jgi:hypothetical protein